MCPLPLAALPLSRAVYVVVKIQMTRHSLLLLFLSSFQKRLLHPGASTADILSQYISTMKSLHVVDPSGAAAERVCQPVQAYLRYVRMLNCPSNLFAVL